MKIIKIGICTLLPSILAATSLLLTIPIVVNQTTKLNNDTVTNNKSVNSVAAVNPNNVMKSEVSQTIRIRWDTPSADIGNYAFWNNMQTMLPFNYKGDVYSIANNESGGLIVYDSIGNIVNSFGSSDLPQRTGSSFKIIETAVASSQGSYIYISALNVYGSTGLDGSYSTMYKWDWNTDKLTTIADFKNSNTTVKNSKVMGVIPGKTEADDMLIGFFNDYNNHTNSRVAQYPYYVVDIAHGTTFTDTFVASSVSGSGSTHYNQIQSMLVLKTNNLTNPYDIILFTRGFDNTDFNAAYIDKIPFHLDNSNKVTFANSGQKHQLGAYWFYSVYQEMNRENKDILTSSIISNDEKDVKHFNVNTYNSRPNNSDKPHKTEIEDFYLQPVSSDTDLSKNVTWNGVSHQSDKVHILEQDGSSDGRYNYELHSNSRRINSTNSKLNIDLNNDLDGNYKFEDVTSTIKGFSYADVDKSKMLLFDSNNMVSQYDLNTNKYSLVKGIAPVDKTSTYYKNLIKQSPSQITKTNISQLLDIKGLTIDSSNTKITANDKLGTLDVSLVAHDKNNNEFTYNETVKGFSTYETNPSWQVNWADDSKVNKNQYAIKGGVSDTDILKWCKIGDLIKPFEIGEPLIKRNQFDGSIKITTEFKNLPADFDSSEIVTTHTYTGFKTGVLPPSGLSHQDIIIAIAVSCSIAAIFLIGLTALFIYKQKENSKYKNRKANSTNQNTNRHSRKRTRHQIQTGSARKNKLVGTNNNSEVIQSPRPSNKRPTNNGTSNKRPTNNRASSNRPTRNKASNNRPTRNKASNKSKSARKHR